MSEKEDISEIITYLGNDMRREEKNILNWQEHATQSAMKEIEKERERETIIKNLSCTVHVSLLQRAHIKTYFFQSYDLQSWENCPIE